MEVGNSSIEQLFGVLLALGFVNILAWLSPGPNMLVVMSATISKGRRAGVATSLGLVLGGMIWATLTIIGAATVFELFPTAVLAFRLLGASYLAWLGYKYLRSAWLGHGAALEVTKVEHSDWHALRNGFFVILTNPKAVLYFSSVFAVFIPASAPVWMWVVIVLFNACQAFTLHCLTMLLFSSKPVLRRIQTAQRKVGAIIGTLYVGLGLGVAIDALRRI